MLVWRLFDFNLILKLLIELLGGRFLCGFVVRVLGRGFKEEE